MVRGGGRKGDGGGREKAMEEGGKVVPLGEMLKIED